MRWKTAALLVGILAIYVAFAAAGDISSWKAQFYVTAGSYKDTLNFIGVEEGASDEYDFTFDLPEPPAPPSNYIRLFFPHPEWGPHAGNYTTDIRAPYEAGAKVWYFKIDADGLSPGTVVNLSWDFDLPEEFMAVLYDFTACKSLVIEPEGSYVYATEARTRNFAVTVGKVPTRTSWRFRITGIVEGLKDEIVTGVESGATDGFDSDYDIPKPPEPPGGTYLRMCIVGGATPTELSHDIREPYAVGVKVWTLKIRAVGLAGKTLKLDWLGNIMEPDAEVTIKIGDQEFTYGEQMGTEIEINSDDFEINGEIRVEFPAEVYSWKAIIDVESGALSDRGNIFGVEEGAIDDVGPEDVPEPPAPPVSSYLRAYFLLKDSPEPFMVDVREPYTTGAKSWVFVVEGKGATQEVTLKWGRFIPPEGFEAVLYDIDGEQAVNMAEEESYIFTPGSDEFTRKFVITVRAKVRSNEWFAPIVAEANGFTDKSCIFGVAPDAKDDYDGKDLPKPPAPPQGIYLSFRHAGWPAGTDYASDIRAPLVPGETKTWILHVEANKLSGVPATIFFHVLNLPEMHKILLVDPDTGYQQDLSEKPVYKFVPDTESVTKEFRIVVTRSVPADNWRVRLDVEAGGYADRQNTAGVAPDASDGYDPYYDYPEPPTPPAPYISAYFYRPDMPDIKYAKDIRAPFATGEKVWLFEVKAEGIETGTLVRITWPDFAPPEGYTFTLKDLTTGYEVNLMDVSEYTFAFTGEKRQFELRVSVGVATEELKIYNMHVEPEAISPNGDGVNDIAFISFNVNRVAEVSVEIRDIDTGEVIRDIYSGVVSGGLQVEWDGKDNTGNVVPDGTYLVFVDANSGEATASAHVRVDTTAPAIEIYEPADGLITSATSVNVVGKVTDVLIDWVKVNGQEVEVDETGNFSTTVALEENATTEITVEAQDAAGNRTQASVRVYCDRMGPAIAITEPEEGAILLERTVVVKGTAADIAGVEEIRVNDVPAVYSTTEHTFLATVELPLPEGEKSITVVAWDTFGNESEEQMNVVIDLTPPYVRIVEPEDGFMRNNPTVEVKVEARDTATGIDKVLVNGATAEKQGDYYVATINLGEDGTKEITAVAFDLAGRISIVEITGILDTTPPATKPCGVSPIGVTITTPYPMFLWTEVSQDRGTPIRYWIQVAEDSNFTAIKANATVESTVYVPTEPLLTEEASKAFYWHVKAVDAVGNEGAWSDTYQFSIDLRPIAAPEITEPEDGLLTNQATITVSGLATGEGADTKVFLRINGSLVAAGTVESGTGRFVFNSVGLYEGTNEIEVRLKRGDLLSAPDTVTVYLDTTPPEKPTILKPASGEAFGTQNVEIEGRAEANATVEIRIGTTVATVEADVDGKFTYTYTANESGRYILECVAIDRAGNRSQPSETTFIVDLDNPATPELTEPINGAIVENTWTPTLKWHEATDETTYVAYYRVQVATDENMSHIVAEATTEATEISFNLKLNEATEETFYWHVKAIDAVGHESSFSPVASFTIRIEVAPPEITLIEPEEGAIFGQPTITVKATFENATSFKILLNGESLYEGGATDEVEMDVDLEEGENNIGVVVYHYDASLGATAESSVVRAVYLDTMPPEITDYEPTGTLTYRTPTVKAKITDNLAGVKASSVKMFINDEQKPAFFDSSSGTVMYAETFEDGEYTVRIEVEDAVGNRAVATWEFAVDTTPPMINVHVDVDSENHRVDLTILTDEPATASAWLLYGGEEHPVDLTQETPTRFTATDVSIPADVTSAGIKVQAEDLYGNTGMALVGFTIATVDPSEGGSVETPDGNAGTDIPPQASGEEITVTITPAAPGEGTSGGSQSIGIAPIVAPMSAPIQFVQQENNDNDEQPDLRIASGWYHFDPEEYTFNPPAVVKLCYAGYSVDESKIAMYLWDGSKWVYQPASVVNTYNKTVVLQVSEYPVGNIYGVFEDRVAPSVEIGGYTENEDLTVTIYGTAKDGGSGLKDNKVYVMIQKLPTGPQYTYEVEVEEDDTWQVNVGAIEGSWRVYATAYDNMDNARTVQKDVNVVVDNIAPTVQAPVEDRYTKEAIYRVGIKVSDNRTGTVEVELVADGVVVDTADVAVVEGQMTVATLEYVFESDAAKLFKIRARDRYGNVAETDTWKVVYDVSPPLVTIVEPAPGSVVTARTVAVRGRFVDFGPAGFEKVELYVGEELVAEVTSVDALGYFTATIMLPDKPGHYVIKAKGVDKCGNEEIYSVYIDLEMPVPIAPEDGAVLSSRTVTFMWEPISVEATYEIEVTRGQETIVITAKGNETTYTFTKDGEYTWRMRAVVDTGPGDWTEERTFIIDTTAPSAPGIIKPAEGTHVNQKAGFTLAWIAPGDAGTSVATYEVRAYRPGEDVPVGLLMFGAVVAAGATGERVVTFEELPNGTYEISLVAYDLAGNASESGRVKVVFDATPPEFPEIGALVSPANGQTVTTTNVKFIWRQAEDISKPVIYEVHIVDLMGEEAPEIVKKATDTTSISVELEDRKTYGWYVVAIDSVEENPNVATSEEKWTFTVDTTAKLRIEAIDLSQNPYDLASEEPLIIGVWVSKTADITFTIYNMAGELILCRTLEGIEGGGRAEVALYPDELKPGLHVVYVIAKSGEEKARIVKAFVVTRGGAGGEE